MEKGEKVLIIMISVIKITTHKLPVLLIFCCCTWILPPVRAVPGKPFCFRTICCWLAAKTLVLGKIFCLIVCRICCCWAGVKFPDVFICTPAGCPISWSCFETATVTIFVWSPVDCEAMDTRGVRLTFWLGRALSRVTFLMFWSCWVLMVWRICCWTLTGT